jgi:hypothetical protein
MSVVTVGAHGCRTSLRPPLFVVDFSNGSADVSSPLSLIPRAAEAVGVPSASLLAISPTSSTYATATRESVTPVGVSSGHCCHAKLQAPLRQRIGRIPLGEAVLLRVREPPSRGTHISIALISRNQVAQTRPVDSDFCTAATSRNASRRYRRVSSENSFGST